MSYDLRLENGDIQFGTDGNPVIVENTEKLKQDISKIILTQRGTDPGSIQYGTKLQQVLGQPFDFNILQSLIVKTVAEALNFLQSLQYVQATKQDFSYQETIGSVDSVIVSQGAGFGRLEIRLMITSIGGVRQIYAIRLGE